MTLIAVLFISGLDATTLGASRYITERQAEFCPMPSSNASSCGQVCVVGFEDPGCNIVVAFTKIEDTAGVTMPLTWTNYSDDPVQVTGIKYFEPATENTFGCNATQFTFFNSVGQDAGVAYLTPGQLGHGCVDFYNSTVVSYNGVNMYVPVPEGLSDVGQ